jgi:hypothetical protein
MPISRAILSIVVPDFRPSMPVSGVLYLLGTIAGGLCLWKYLEVPTHQWARNALQHSLSRPQSTK